jgi:plastocyanin
MRRAAALLIGLGVLAFAHVAFGGADQATTWQVAVGEQAKPPAGTPKGTTLNQFFPARISVNAGDKVTFTSFTFHTVSYWAGKAPPPPLGPAPGAEYEGITGADGQPFYFDGMQAFSYNVDHFGPVGPKTVSGKTATSTGALFATSPKKPGKATLTFPKAGAFKLVCNLHAGMEMSVVVRPKGAAVPTAEEVAAKAKAETDAAWAQARALAATKPPRNTVIMGIDGTKTAGGRLTILDFLPSLTTVKVGTTVNFPVRAPSEAHNVALGPLKYMDRFMKQTDLFPMGPGSKNQVTPVFIYGSDPRGTEFDGRNHGNGFYATGLADGVRGGLPNAVRVTFTAPGKYHFICLLHGPDMAADIRVTR